ncbi:MAG TPA: DUF192 domain-containing protein, partial [Novosphingobium sp.]|nr:DUF192 domain-containing protein [Novosphingobium sp.]
AEAGQPTPTSTSTTRHPVSGLAVIPLTIASQGKRHAFRVEVARTAAEQAQGLMFRTAMGADEGMLFIRNPPDRASFWMRNTVIPLDLVFIGTDRRVINVAADAVPYDETPILSAGVAGAVLELNGGRAAQLGIRAGDAVEW